MSLDVHTTSELKLPAVFLTCSYGLLGGHDGVGKQDDVPAAGATDLILHLLLFWFVSKIPKVYLLYYSWPKILTEGDTENSEKLAAMADAELHSG